MEWSEDDIVWLIEEYRRHELLWNPRHKDYKKRNLKRDAYEDIGRMLSKSNDEVERKISVILAQYRRCRQKGERMKKSGMGTEEIDKEMWFGYKHMVFLSDRYRPNETRETEPQDAYANVGTSETNVKSNDVTVDEANTTDSNEPPDKELHVNDLTENATESLEVISKKGKRVLTTKKHVSKNIKTTENDNQAAEAFGILKTIYEKKNVSPDACSLFASHIAMKLRGFDPLTRAHVEFKINKIIYEAEISTLNPQFTNQVTSPPASYVDSQPHSVCSAAMSSPCIIYDTDTSTLDPQSPPQHFGSPLYDESSSLSIVQNANSRPGFCSTPMPSPQGGEHYDFNEYIITRPNQILN